MKIPPFNDNGNNNKLHPGSIIPCINRNSLIPLSVNVISALQKAPSDIELEWAFLNWRAYPQWRAHAGAGFSCSAWIRHLVIEQSALVCGDNRKKKHVEPRTIEYSFDARGDKQIHLNNEIIRYRRYSRSALAAGVRPGYPITLLPCSLFGDRRAPRAQKMNRSITSVNFYFGKLKWTTGIVIGCYVSFFFSLSPPHRVLCFAGERSRWKGWLKVSADEGGGSSVIVALFFVRFCLCCAFSIYMLTERWLGALCCWYCTLWGGLQCAIL